MLNDYFYHATIRRTIAAFGSLFNNLKVIRTDSAGEVKNITRVPLSYGPRQKFLNRIEAEPDFTNPAVALKLPRMSFEITSLTYDAAAQTNKINRIRKGSISSGSQNVIYTCSPWKISIDLNILAKNQDDALQIVEQILPYFQPEYTITLKEIPSMGIKGDVPIVLTSVSFSDDYEGDYVTRRAIIYTLSFEMRARFYGPIQDKGVILTASVDMNLEGEDTFGFLEEVVAESPDSILIETGVDTTDDNEITP